MKNIKKLTFQFFAFLLIVTMIFSLSSCNRHSTEKTVNTIEKKVNAMLKKDLNSSIEIIKLYYNEEKQGCFVMFETVSYADKAAINLDTGVIEYESEYDYWSTKIGEHEYNQKILNSFYAEWNFAITVFEANGRPKDSDWERIK